MTSRDLAPQDAELIAAFVDKRLSEDERKAFLERLDKDEALYEVFVETVRYREESAGAPGGELIEPAVWQKKWFLPAAAAAVLALAGFAVVLMRGGAQESYAEMLVADGRLEPFLTEGWYEQGWEVSRGTSPGAGETVSGFRLGVRALDLQIALRRSAVEEAKTITHRIEALLKELKASEPLQFAYAAVRRDLENGTAPELLADQVETQALLLRGQRGLSAPFDLGRWAEAGRLAARSGNLDLLRSEAFRARSDQLAAEEWPTAISGRLATIKSLLEPTSGKLDLERLEWQFVSLIEEY